MSKREHLNQELLLDRLRLFMRHGPITAKAGAQHLGPISQQAFAKLVPKLGDSLLVMGKARSTKYALKRSMHKCENPFPIFKIDSNGKARRLGKLTTIYPHGFYFEPDQGKNEYFEDIPFFLEDMRPAGFLGRLIPSQYPEENFPKDIGKWQIDHLLYYLNNFAWNTTGNLLLGEASLQAFISNCTQPQASIELSQREKKYLALANDIIQYGETGSSAVGEQPKFLCNLASENSNPQAMMVKFSPNEDSRLARRRADLLICEHLAHLHLNEHKINAAQSEILHAEYRTFLAMQRFDRNGEFGRRGMISLNALDLEFVGEGDFSWSVICEKLVSRGYLDSSILKSVRELELFGQLIGNSDMHTGNLAFYYEDMQLQGLTSVYDMLPMLYAPKDENIVDRVFVPPIPKAANVEEWRKIYPIAISYWKRVLQHKDISSDFQQIASQHLQELKEIAPSLALLP